MSLSKVALSGLGNAVLNTGNLLQSAVYSLTGISSGSCSAAANGSTTVTLGETPDATMSLSDTNAVCVGTTLNVLFSGTPNATVTYQVNGGANQTVVLNASGNASLSTGAINANTTYFLVNASNGNCTRTIGLTRNIIVTQNTYYLDSDGDGFGVTANSIIACTLPAGYAAVGGDCCDSNPNLNPLTEWWADVDGDGYGSISFNLGCVNGTVTCSNTSWPNQPQLIPYYAAANNGNSYVLDCNDANTAVRPNALEICGNTADDDCDGLINEGCSTMPNDNFTFATTIGLQAYPSCVGALSGTLDGTDRSPQGNPANVLPGAGQDVWYKFIANSTAIRFVLTPNGFNGVLELKNAAGNVQYDAENANNTDGGIDIMNYSGLVVGQEYRIGVRAFSQLTGTFTLCAASLLPSGCSLNPPAGGVNLCTNIKARSTGGNVYVFNFTEVGGNAPLPYTTTSVSTTGIAVLSNATLGLVYGGVYDVSVDVVYNLANGVGAAETITVSGAVAGSCDNLTIMNQPNMAVRNSQLCTFPATLSRTSALYGDVVVPGASICSNVNYTFEFVKVTDCAGLVTTSQPILANSAGSGAILVLSTVFATNAAANGYWKVRLRPNFVSGPGQFGPERVIFINSPSGMILLSDDEVVNDPEKTEGIQVYPNPSSVNESFEISFGNELPGIFDIEIVDATGRRVVSSHNACQGGGNCSIELLNGMAPGIYLMDIKRNGESMKQVRLVRE